MAEPKLRLIKPVTKRQHDLTRYCDPIVSLLTAPEAIWIIALRLKSFSVRIERGPEAHKRFRETLKEIAREGYSNIGPSPVVKTMLIYEEARALLGGQLKRDVAEAMWRRHGRGQFPEELWSNLNSVKAASARARHFVAAAKPGKRVEPESIKKMMQRWRKRRRTGGT